MTSKQNDCEQRYITEPQVMLNTVFVGKEGNVETNYFTIS
jgi:hypothetical protein